jgi:hypothetical protein
MSNLPFSHHGQIHSGNLIRRNCGSQPHASSLLILTRDRPTVAITYTQLIDTSLAKHTDSFNISQTNAARIWTILTKPLSCRLPKLVNLSIQVDRIQLT